MSPRDSLGLLTMLERDREEEGFETPTWEALLECFEAQNGQHLPLSWRESTKASNQKFAGNAIKCTKQLKKISVSENINFCYKNLKV